MSKPNEHRFEPEGGRMICQNCGLIQHRGNEVTPCSGPQLLDGRYQLGHPIEDEDPTEYALTPEQIIARYDGTIVDE